MSISFPQTRILATIAAVLVLGATWWFLAPTQLGGRTSYAVIYGISMEPNFHKGDLVILRAEPSYHVGEIVAYHSHDLNRSVMHRIVGRDGNRYIFKGDNNNFRDPEHPTASQLFGKEWLRIPGAGSKLEHLRRPRNAAIFAGAAALFLLAGGSAGTRRRRRRRSQGHRPERITSGFAASSTLPPLAFGVLALGVAGVVSTGLLAFAAYSKPLEKTIAQSDLYSEQGVFTADATAPLSAPYDHTKLGAKDAFFTNLVNDVRFGFRFTTTSKVSTALGGSIKLDAHLTDSKGWSRRLSLAPLQSFHGPTAQTAGTINLKSLVQLVKRFEAQTGELNTSYNLDLTPVVQLHGLIGTKAVTDTFAPKLSYILDEHSLRLDTGPGVNSSLKRSKSGWGTTAKPQQLSALGRVMRVADARHIATIGGLISVLILLLGAALFFLARGGDEVTAIMRRYGDWIVDVTPGNRPPGSERRLGSMEALARIAERYERLILHERNDRVHSFLVEDDGLVYRYDAHERTIFRGHGQPPPPPAEEQTHEEQVT